MIHLTAQTVSLIAVLGGIVANPVTSLLKRENWSTQVKQLVALAVSCAVTVVAIAIDQPAVFRSGISLASLAALVYTASQGVYILLFKGSAVESALARVGSKAQAAAKP